MSEPRLADCDNYLEAEDRPCAGTLRFYLNDLQAACDSCGAWCGYLVANYRPTPTNASETP